MHKRWSLRQLQVLPALLPSRRASRRILTPWTKVSAPPSEPSLHTAGPLPLQPGALHSARCWRFTSARCCAPSERHVRVGMPDCSPHFQCANCLRPLRCSPGLSHLTQVSPVLPTPAASLACLRSGARLHQGRFFGAWSFRVGSSLSAIEHQVSVYAALSLGPFAQLWTGMCHLRSGPFGSRHEILRGLPNQTRGQGCVHSHRSRQLTFGLPALVYRVGIAGTLNLQAGATGFRRSSTCILTTPTWVDGANALDDGADRGIQPAKPSALRSDTEAQLWRTLQRR